MTKKRGPKKRADSKVSTSIRVSPDTLARLRATGNVSATVERLVRGTAPTITERPTCETCPYWSRHFSGDTSGDCRADPPRPACANHRTFAETHQDSWCSRHPDFPAYLASRVEQPKEQA